MTNERKNDESPGSSTEPLELLHDVVLRTHSTLTEGPLVADRTKMLICAALGLAGESGEVVDCIKKWYEQGRAIDRDKIRLELFDVAYYTQLALMSLDMSWEEVVQAGRAKLATRFPKGFTEEAAKQRTDETIQV